jgi:hypothetical protein
MFSVSGKMDNNAGRAKSQGKDEIERSASRQRSPALSAAVFNSGSAAAYLRKHKAQLCAELTSSRRDVSDFAGRECARFLAAKP